MKQYIVPKVHSEGYLKPNRASMLTSMLQPEDTEPEACSDVHCEGFKKPKKF